MDANALKLKEEFRLLVTQTAGILGMTPNFDDDFYYNYCRMEYPNRIERIVICDDRSDKTGRIDVRGDYNPRNSAHRDSRFVECPVIKCSKSRTPAAIAADIQRRFIPKFLEAADLITKQEAEEIERIGKIEASEQKILSVLRMVPRSDHKTGRDFYFSRHNDDDYNTMTFSVGSHGRSVSFAGSMTMDVFLQLANVIHNTTEKDMR